MRNDKFLNLADTIGSSLYLWGKEFSRADGLAAGYLNVLQECGAKISELHDKHLPEDGKPLPIDNELLRQCYDNLVKASVAFTKVLCTCEFGEESWDKL